MSETGVQSGSCAIALATESMGEDLKRTVFPHPVLFASMHESVPDAYNMSVNQ